MECRAKNAWHSMRGMFLLLTIKKMLVLLAQY